MSKIIQFIILGLVQGFTEPIPVSSSGHIMLINNLLKTNIDMEILATLTNFGSLIAIAFLYRERIITLFKDFFSCLNSIFKKVILKKPVEKKDKKTYNNFRYCLLLIIGTMPAGIMGLIVTKLDLFDFLEDNIKFVGVTLLITALFLFAIRNIKGKIDSDEISFKNALIIGIFQVFALLPGISRSGATIVGGMSQNLKRETAFDFSFILYIPISVATALLGIKDLFESSLNASQWIGYLSATVVAGLFTYFATKWFRNVVKEGKLIYFVVYCLVVGSIVILFL